MPSHEFAERLHTVFDPVPDDIDLASVDPGRIPLHIAVIMDGNGRWAEQRGITRALGHKAGIDGVRALIRTANDLGVRYLTIYSFSTENWARPAVEVKALMSLFAKTMAAELEGLHAEQVRIRTIGDLSPLPAKTRDTFRDAAQRTAANTGMTLVIAVNYGSQLEIVAAARRIAHEAAAGDLDAAALEALDPATFEGYLETTGIPDPDLLIRTSGEYRLSNFLLFQIAYSELYVTPVLWPDFDKYELLRAILAFQGRQRRFGGV
ncbi:MAG: isoprenyl transferase [Coriobacteriales bacterium]|nr:isoprenyl transferase [Coriobacteriales bacterium]